MLSKEQQFHLRVAEDAFRRHDLAQLGEFRLDFSCLQGAGLLGQFPQLHDLLAQVLRVDRGDHILQVRQDLLLLLLRQIVEIVRYPLPELLLSVGLRVFQNLGALGLHALEGTPDSIDARGKTALEHGHGESERPSARRVVLGRLK